MYSYVAWTKSNKAFFFPCVSYVDLHLRSIPRLFGRSIDILPILLLFVHEFHLQSSNRCVSLSLSLSSFLNSLLHFLCVCCSSRWTEYRIHIGVCVCMSLSLYIGVDWHFLTNQFLNEYWRLQNKISSTHHSLSLWFASEEISIGDRCTRIDHQTPALVKESTEAFMRDHLFHCDSSG